MCFNAGISVIDLSSITHHLTDKLEATVSVKIGNKNMINLTLCSNNGKENLMKLLTFVETSLKTYIQALL